MSEISTRRQASPGPLEAAQKFVAAARAATDIGELAGPFAQAARDLGFTEWITVVFEPPYESGRAYRPLDGFNREWIENYIKSRFFEVDPVHHMLLTTSLPFLWHEVRAAQAVTKRQRAILRDAEAAGVAAGISIGLRAETHGLIAISMAAAAHDFEPGVQHGFHLVAIYLADAIQRLTPGRQDRHSEGAVPAAATPPLTGREAEILLHLAKGASMEVIAGTLGISERTVRFHIENAKSKYGVATTMQAVVQAISDNSIKP